MLAELLELVETLELLVIVALVVLVAVGSLGPPQNLGMLGRRLGCLIRRGPPRFLFLADHGCRLPLSTTHARKGRLTWP